MLGKIWELAQTADKVLQVVNGAVEVGEAVYDGCMVVQDPDMSTIDKVHRVGTDAALAVLRTGNLVADYKKDASSKVKVGMQAGAEIARVAQVGSRKVSKKESLEASDYVDVVMVTVQGAANVGQSAVKNFPKQCEAYKTFIEKGNKGVSIGLKGVELYRRREAIEKFCSRLGSSNDSSRSRASQAHANYEVRNSAPQSDAAQEHSSLEAEKSPRVEEAPRASTQPSDEPVEIHYTPTMEAALRTQSVKDIPCIPEELFTHSVLENFKCSITGKPIRFVLVVEETWDDEEPVFYERSEVERWMREHEGVKPPRWPDSAPLSKTKLVAHRHIQHMIDKGLAAAIAEFKQDIA